MIARSFALPVLFVLQAVGVAIPADPRIHTVTYNPDQVVVLSVTPGYAAVVALGSDERVESIVVGNSDEWQVTASKRGDDIVVKPLAGASSTNMVIATGSRHFVFQLQASDVSGPAPYILRFVYPDASPVQPDVALPIATFRFKGDRSLIPVAMSDDGVRTRIQWAKDISLPAIFAVDRGNQEAIVNGRMVGDIYVVERVAPRFVFRRGTSTATASRQTRAAER